MRIIKKGIAAFSRWADYLAALGLAASMLLVVSNIILRAAFNSPILGTYEYVGYLTAASIGLSLANCAIKDGHISLSLFTDMFPNKVRSIADLVIKAISFISIIIASVQVFKYALDISKSGEVSPTTQTPFYPFIYIIAFGMLLLALVIIMQIFAEQKKEDK